MKKHSISRSILSLFVIAVFFSFFQGNAFAAKESYAGYSDIRISGSTRYHTAVEVSKKGWPNGANTVLIARGDSYPDALAGAPLAAKLDAPILLSRPDSLPDVTKEEIKRLGATEVIILGGPGAISDKVKNEINPIVSKVDRIRGANRFETALKIAEKLGSNSGKAIVATGYNFADALAAAPYAAENQYPILLTNKNQIDNNVKEYLKGYSETIVVGGAAAVSEEVKNQLPSPIRLSGQNRYETAAEIIRYGYKTNNQIYISTGEEFADALTGSVLAAKKDTAVMLVNKSITPERVELLIPEQQVRSLQVLGGITPVPDNVVGNLLTLINKYADTSGAATLSDEVEVLESGGITQLHQLIEQAVPNDDGTFYVKVPTSSPLAHYEKNDLLLIPPSEEEPLGLMLQVGEVSVSGNEKTIKLGQPPLEAIFDSLKISGEEDLTLDKLVDFDLHEGVTLQPVEGMAVSSYEEFENTMKTIKNSALYKSNPSNYFAGVPFTLGLDATLYEREISSDEKYSVDLQGSYILDASKTKYDIEENIWGKLTAFDLHFKGKQTVDAALTVKWNGDLVPEDKTEQRERILEGVDREGRVTLASATFNGGAFVLGEEAMEKTPIGITIFVVSTLDGDISLEGKLSFIDERKYDVKAEWDEDEDDFTYDSNPETIKSEATLEASGSIKTTKSVGLDIGLNIFSLVPAVVENDLRETLNIEGNGTATWDFTDPDWVPEVQGCFDAHYNVGMYSTFKARLMATFAVWEMGFEYENEFLNLPLFEERFNKCIPAGKVTGTVINAVSKEPLSGVKITAYKDGEFYRSASSDEDGSYELELQPGTYKLKFGKLLYQEETLDNAEVTEDGFTYNPELKLIYQDYIGDGEAGGQITNALNGSAIPGATIEFRKGMNTTSGEIVKTVTTDSTGKYKLTLRAGSYTGVIKKDGFVGSSFNILIIGSLSNLNQNATITPILEDAETRIVLSWGATPSDLDSHLLGPAIGSDRFHLYYNNRTHYENGVLMANLDRDDTSSYGPETTTINVQKDGTYEYYIFNYSNRSSTGNMALAQSGAKVEVYRGSYLVKTFNVPTNKAGKYWKVFELRGNQIIPINEVTDSYQSTYSSVELNEIEKETMMEKQ